jgi:hypothetical protein
MIFLLYYSLMKVIDIAKETYKVQHTEQVLTEDKVAVLPNELEDNRLLEPQPEAVKPPTQ